MKQIAGKVTNTNVYYLHSTCFVKKRITFKLLYNSFKMLYNEQIILFYILSQNARVKNTTSTIELIVFNEDFVRELILCGHYCISLTMNMLITCKLGANTL